MNSSVEIRIYGSVHRHPSLPNGTWEASGIVLERGKMVNEK
jgi:hypothetical protein